MHSVGGPRTLIGGRFESVRRIGEGGFGVVYEALDTKFGGRVAVKVLRAERAAAALRFKREFRSLVDLQHANLVRLFELASHGSTLYFSMELVDGVDFLAHVSCAGERAVQRVTEEWPPPPRVRREHAVSADRLRAALIQVVDAVQALHDAGKLHCDVKPTNVLVAGDGRVVLLDFGLVADLDETTRSALGTPGYMAPEQVRGGALSEATDWYGVGAMVHEAITGELPRGGVPCTTALAELQPLAALCNELLAADPARRLDGANLIARLGATGARVARATTRLFGRERELVRLREAWREVQGGAGAQLVRVVGPSGIGKTALVAQLLSEIRGEPAMVLAGRCYEQESIPYKALDGAIDALADAVTRSGDALPRLAARAGVLARVFPVLRPLVRDDAAAEEQDSQALRRRAFHELRELMVEISARRPLAILLDDLQWGDVDSARLLAELVLPPDAPRMLVIACYRPDTAADGFLAALDELPLGIPDARIELGELSDDDAERFAAHLVGSGRGPSAARIGREAAGNPLFIQQLADAAHDRTSDTAPGLRELILARLGALESNARRLVETVALAAAPLDEGVAIAAAALDASAARAATLAVRQARLLTARTTAGAVLLEPAHDRVRETVAAAIPADRARDSHLRIAETLLGRPRPDPEALVHHFRHAGDRDRARVHALVAAERAESALAFDRAAGHLQLVLELSGPGTGDRSQLLERHGAALANAGRGSEAAESFERAADDEPLDDARALMLRRRAGELTLRSGHIELGLARMDRVLRTVGVRVPAGRRSAAALGILRRIRLFAHGTRPRVRPAASAPAAMARLEALWSASTGISMINHVLADALGLQHMLEAIALGERSHLVRGLGYEAAFEAVIGGRFLRKRCAQMLETMDALARESSDPYDRAWAQMSIGVTRWFVGDWPAAWRNCDDAAAIYREQCRGVAWELAICDAYRLPALAYLGELAELARVVPRAYVGARERGDLYAVNLLRLGQQSMTSLVDDRPDTALDEARAAIAPFPAEPFLLPHYHHAFAVAQAELYRGNAELAWRPIEQSWRGLQQSRLLVVQCLRCEIRHLRARAAIARAADGPRGDGPRLRALARNEAARIARDDVAPAAPFAAAIRAGIAVDPEDRRRELTAALRGFENARMRLYAHACRDRLGALIGASHGAELRASAAAWFATQGIRDPARMVAMLVPGT